MIMPYDLSLIIYVEVYIDILSISPHIDIQRSLPVNFDRSKCKNCELQIDEFNVMHMNAPDWQMWGGEAGQAKRRVRNWQL